MTRPKKYKEKAEIISLSIDPEVLRSIDKKAKKLNLKRSDYINRILRDTQSDKEFARMMAKKHNREMYYWKSEAERLESEEVEDK